ncbi:polysaccharide biosynthesis protein [uncultured Dysosmobacter sp.]|uniref:putative polysaccharide biosynthesis protein n=1 Tax=uncultured Dysosmobacter sp. TaxID=2591384 RepID=UPI00261F2B89|nr:polysaccharide biosynthesis protein [uncultured Dysosmobacter sp.]
MSNQKKQSFLGGAAILAAAVAIVKIIGAFYKFPLNNILGGEGKAYFNTAYYIYNVLLTISTAGLPLAISKMTSQAHAQGRENEKRKIFRTAIVLFFCLGAVGSAFMYFRAEGLASFLENSLAHEAVRALAPAVFCVCLLACMRGYTQGQGNMTPTAVSQVLEALCKLGIGLPLAWYLLKTGRGLQLGAAGAIFGVTVGTMLSMLFLIAYLATHRNHEKSLDVPSSSAALMKQILVIGIPITLSNSAMSIINLIDTKIVMGQLQNALLLSETDAAALNGQYGMAMDMPNMVASFVYPVTMSLIPFAAAALAQGDHARADRIVSSAFRLIAILALPAGIGLSVLSTPIMVLVLPAQYEDALAAGPHLRILGIALIFICLMILTNAILQTYGKEKLPIFTVVAGGATKIVMNYILVGNPDINIHGAPVSTLCCYLVICGLNLFFVWKYSPAKPRYVQLFAKPVLASVLMGGAAWAVYGFAARALSGHSVYGANAIATLAGICAGVAVYAVLVIALRILRAEDVRSIPHGEKMIRLLHLK